MVLLGSLCLFILTKYFPQKFSKQEKGGKRIEAQYAWTEPPGQHFTADKSNKEEAFKHAKKKVQTLLKKNPEVRLKLHELQQKCIKNKARNEGGTPVCL